MNDLDKLAVKYKADKFGKHNYTAFYYDLFQHNRNNVKTVVELGIGEGASLRMWHDFFPNAKIYGADIEPERYREEDGYPRIEIVKCDQTKLKDVDELVKLTEGEIDLFIDDGSHKTSDQFLTALAVVPYLKTGSIYVIEDVAEPEMFYILQKALVVLTLAKCEMMPLSKRYDDRLIVITKGL